MPCCRAPTRSCCNPSLRPRARIFGAGAASILLVNEADQTLEFVIATGETQKAVVGLTMPLDKGIAGYVAMTGQPIAVSKVQQDARFHAEVAIRTGYMPDSILAAPLLSGDRVIGVMEVLDKIRRARLRAGRHRDAGAVRRPGRAGD